MEIHNNDAKMSLSRNLAEFLTQRKEASLYRSRQVLESPQGTHVRLEGKTYLSFCSNDYLGLANDPRIIEALQHGAQRYGVGSGAAHLVNGHSQAHHELEQALADFIGYERALLFSTGYMANMGVISALLDHKDTIIEDKLNHASLIDGARLAQAKLKRYKHADCQSLQQQISLLNQQPCLVATDSVFSMDGDIAPLHDISTICHQHNSLLMVDDAHGLGVLGKQGRGALSHLGLSNKQVPLYVGTLGKAFGTFGAFVAGSKQMIEALIQLARTYIYTTALPPAVAHATLKSLAIVKEENWRRERLQNHIKYFRDQAQSIGYQLCDSSTAIQPVIIGDSQQAVSMSIALKEKGILITAIRPPTVPQGSARLRITFSAQHTQEDIERLLETLSQIRRSEG